MSKVFDTSTSIINCSENTNRSMMSEETIRKYLYSKLSRTSITIVLLTPNSITHEKNWNGQIDDWIYDEIRYSLEDRENNKCNGLIAVYTKEAKDLLVSIDSASGTVCVNNVYNLFRRNMMNIKPQYKKNTKPNLFDSDYDSYCSLISYENFISNPNNYINIAEEKRDNIYKYDITKRMQ